MQRVSTSCVHCGRPSRDGRETCCDGCDAAYGLLRDLDLERYYALGDRPGRPPAAPRSGTAFVDAAWAERTRAAGGRASVELDVQGIRCAACVWVIEELFQREPGALSCELTPGVGRLRLEVEEERFDLARLSDHLGTLGYRLAPRGAAKSSPYLDELVLRLGVSAAIAMNTMLMSLPLYLGVDEPRVRSVMGWASLGLGTAAVFVGGSPFVKSAVASLRRGVVHLDVPIALGLVAAYAGSVFSFARQDGRASYFDTLAVFVTLMLLGRWLTERVLEKNRRALLSERPLHSFPVRRVSGDAVEIVQAKDVVVGDELLLRPGDLCPTGARLTSPSTTVSLAWLTGEEALLPVTAGEPIAAGAFVRSDEAIRARAIEDFASSRLPRLAPPPASRDDLPRATLFFQRLSKGYVASVLTLAAVSGLAFAFSTGADHALEVVVALLVVTCPCAFGIAAPLAYEIVQAQLAEQGVRARSRSLLDRMLSVKDAIFDKTGTLTLGEIELDGRALAGIPDADRRVFAAMVSRSRHPKSEALARWFAGHDGPAPHSDFACHETAGRGLSAEVSGGSYRVGAPSWAAEGEALLTAGEVPDLVLSKDGRALASLRTRERLPEDAARSADSLRALGVRLHVLSGDHEDRVRDVAARVGADEIRWAATPEEKAEYLARIDASRALFVGDGVNDVLAAREALVAGTPLSDLPILPAHTDFDVDGSVLEGVLRALVAARRLDRVVREVLVFALAYNAASVLLCLAGLMSPLVAAVVMPISSLASTAWVTWRLRGAATLPARAATSAQAAPGPVARAT